MVKNSVVLITGAAGRIGSSIAHRLSTVRQCVQIYLLERGEVKASGTYDELTASNQQFAAMANHA